MEKPTHALCLLHRTTIHGRQRSRAAPETEKHEGGNPLIQRSAALIKAIDFLRKTLLIHGCSLSLQREVASCGFSTRR